MLGKFSDGAEANGIGENLTVFALGDNSPAYSAGLRVNDVALALNGSSSATVPRTVQELRSTLEQALSGGTPITLDVQRGGEKLRFRVQPEPVCGQTVQMSDQTSINAFADGKRVLITRGMMRFAASDVELSLVIAHEIAHNAMKHIEARMGNQLAGAIIDALIAGLTRTYSTGVFANAAAQAYSQDFEAEADYVGLYILARAAVPIKDAPLFWRRMAAESPGSIGNSHSASHPATSYRMVALQKAVEEIERKRSAGLALLPQMRDAAAPGLAPAAKPEQAAAHATTSLVLQPGQTESKASVAIAPVQSMPSEREAQPPGSTSTAVVLPPPTFHIKLNREGDHVVGLSANSWGIFRDGRSEGDGTIVYKVELWSGANCYISNEEFTGNVRRQHSQFDRPDTRRQMSNGGSV